MFGASSMSSIMHVAEVVGARAGDSGEAPLPYH